MLFVFCTTDLLLVKRRSPLSQNCHFSTFCGRWRGFDYVRFLIYLTFLNSEPQWPIKMQESDLIPKWFLIGLSHKTDFLLLRDIIISPQNVFPFVCNVNYQAIPMVLSFSADSVTDPFAKLFLTYFIRSSNALTLTSCRFNKFRSILSLTFIWWLTFGNPPGYRIAIYFSND